MRSKVTFVTGDDWQGVYLDGELMIENHSVDAFCLMEFLSKEFDFDLEGLTADEEWLADRGRLPESLGWVKIEEEDEE